VCPGQLADRTLRLDRLAGLKPIKRTLTLDGLAGLNPIKRFLTLDGLAGLNHIKRFLTLDGLAGPNHIKRTLTLDGLAGPNHIERFLTLDGLAVLGSTTNGDGQPRSFVEPVFTGQEVTSRMDWPAPTSIAGESGDGMVLGTLDQRRTEPGNPGAW